MSKKQWWNERFVLSSFESTGHLNMDQLEECCRRLRLVKEAGFDLNEITWKTPATTETVLAACLREKMPAILEDPFAGGKMCPAVRDRNSESVPLLLEKYKKYKECIKGLYLFDEPEFESIPVCRELKESLERTDDEILPFFALVPSYGKYTFKNGQYVPYVEKFIKEVDPAVLSFDYYCFWQHCINNPLNRNPLWKDLGYWRKKSLETGKPFWWYYQGINFGPKVPENESHKVITPAHWSVQMYSGLAYNAKGLSCYNAYGSIIDLQGNKTDLYDPVCELIKVIKELGAILYNAKSLGIYHTRLRKDEENNYYLDTYENNPYFVSNTFGIIVSVFEKNGKKLILVVNKNFKIGRNVDIKFLSQKTVKPNIPIQIKEKEGHWHFRLAPGAGVLLIEQ